MKKFNCLLLSLILVMLFSGVVFAEGPSTLNYRGHVSDIGWMDPVSNGGQCGTTGMSKKLEAIEISDPTLTDDNKIQYHAHVSNIGWQNYVENGQTAGTVGQALPIEAIQIRLAGPIANQYDIYYHAHVANIGWLDWAKNDEIAGTAGFSLPMEAIEIQLVPKNSAAPGETARHSITPESLQGTAGVNYITAGDGIGWSGNSSNGAVSGTTGQDIALDGISMSALGIDGGIQYRVGTWSYGWQDWKQDAQVAGTPGRGHFIESFQARLYGPATYLYDVYYQIHNSDVGWLGWAKNGEETGTYNSLRKTQALRVMILPKQVTPEGYDPNATKVVTGEFERPANTVGRNYIYVSVPRQQLIYFGPQNQILFKTPCITGQINTYMATPLGNFVLRDIQREVDLYGADYVDHVHFWLPFIGRQYGIHDADGWRANWEYGGRTYQLDGSHGCVNLPYQSVATLATLVKPGDPVIIR